MSEFWTEADSAELDVLVNALVNDYFKHRERCRACLSDPPSGTPYPCPHVMKAIAEVIEWRDARLLLSRAESLREVRRQVNDDEGRSTAA